MLLAVALGAVVYLVLGAAMIVWAVPGLRLRAYALVPVLWPWMILADGTPTMHRFMSWARR